MFGNICVLAFWFMGFFATDSARSQGFHASIEASLESTILSLSFPEDITLIQIDESTLICASVFVKEWPGKNPICTEKNLKTLETMNAYNSSYGSSVLQRTFLLKKYGILPSISEIKCFTTLYFLKPDSSGKYELRLKGKSREQKDEKETHFDVDVSSVLEGLKPKEIYRRFYPKTVEEGQKYFEKFSEKHLARGLGFRVPNEDYIQFKTLQRTGTYTYIWTIEEIFGEFISSFPELNNGKGIKEGMLMGSQGNRQPIMISHMYLDEKTVKRAVKTVRNLIISLDSNFQLIASGFSMVCKLYGLDYMDDKIYDEWIDTIVSFSSGLSYEKIGNFPVYYSRYEDLVSFPIETMENVLRYITGVPIELTGYKEKIRAYITENGLKSYYMDSQKGKLVDYGVPEDRKGMKRFKNKHIEVVYNKARQHLEYFGYLNEYERILGLQETQLPKELKFQKWNRLTLESSMRYQFKLNQEILEVMPFFEKYKINIKEFRREIKAKKFQKVCLTDENE
jgi:hypothetical protein